MEDLTNNDDDFIQYVMNDIANNTIQKNIKHSRNHHDVNDDDEIQDDEHAKPLKKIKKKQHSKKSLKKLVAKDDNILTMSVTGLKNKKKWLPPWEYKKKMTKERQRKKREKEKMKKLKKKHHSKKTKKHDHADEIDLLDEDTELDPLPPDDEERESVISDDSDQKSKQNSLKMKHDDDDSDDDSMSTTSSSSSSDEEEESFTHIPVQLSEEENDQIYKEIQKTIKNAEDADQNGTNQLKDCLICETLKILVQRSRLSQTFESRSYAIQCLDEFQVTINSQNCGSPVKAAELTASLYNKHCVDIDQKLHSKSNEFLQPWTYTDVLRHFVICDPQPMFDLTLEYNYLCKCSRQIKQSGLWYKEQSDKTGYINPKKKLNMAQFVVMKNLIDTKMKILDKKAKLQSSYTSRGSGDKTTSLMVYSQSRSTNGPGSSKGRPSGGGRHSGNFL